MTDLQKEGFVVSRTLVLRRTAVAAVSAAALVAGGVGTLPAQATVTPGWQPDGNNLGAVQFFDAAGHQIFSGSIDDVPMAAYYKLPSGSATVGHVATTTPEQSNSATWNGTTQITSDQSFPRSDSATLPGDLTGFSGPLVKDDSEASFNDNQITPFPNASTDATYQNLYEIRFYVNSGTTKWYDADILVDPSARTWSEVYPQASGPASTTTVLTAAPASSAPFASSVKLTATVTPHAAGTVDFTDGATDLSGAVAVDTGTGVATFSTSSLAVGSHTFTAAFTPTDSDAFAGSTSSDISYDVTKATPTVSLGASPAGSQYAGQSVTVTATTPNGLDGLVQFQVDGSDSGAPTAASSGQAQLVTATIPVGSHALSAVFTPTDSTHYNPGTSPTVSYVVKDKPAIVPTVFGSHKVGTTEACVASSSDPAATASYTWQLGGVPVSGATAASWRIVDGSLGKKLTCAVAFTNPAGSVSGTSPAVTIGLGNPLAPTVKPFVYGKHVSRTYEYVNVGRWSPAATTYSYQWYVGTTRISHATSSRLLIPAGAKGRVYSCVVTAHRAQYANGVFRTAAVRITA